MNINSISCFDSGANSVKQNNSCGETTEFNKTFSPFFTPFNKTFDEFILSKNNEQVHEITENSDDKMKVIAHRGYSEVAPENTIPAFIAAAENGYNIIECDVEWTKDGVPVILHDATINRTARKQNGWPLFWPRKCSKLTYEELLQYDFGLSYSKDFKGTKIPTFNEVLNCADDNDLNLYVELKEAGDFDEDKAKILADAVIEAGFEDKVTWISFNENYLKIMSEVMPNSRLGYLTKNAADEGTVDILEGLKTGENEVFLDIKAVNITEKSSELIKESGFDFEAWTVDDFEELDDLSLYDCKGITTNKITEDDIEEYYNY